MATIGKYSPYNTFVHRLDPRLKIFSLVVIMVSVFLGYPTWSLTLFMGVISIIFLTIIMIITKVSFLDLLKQLLMMWIMVLLLTAINIFFPSNKCENIMVMFPNGFIIYYEAVFQTLKIIVRLLLMLSLTIILTASSKPLDLTYALEWYMTPLKIIKFPAHEIAMTISIALRFIPTLLDETNRIMKAQASRGVDFERGGLITKIKGLTSLIIPLFVSAFQRSEELADAMEVRGYNPKAKRSRYKIIKWKYTDTLSLIFVLLYFSFFLFVSVLNLDFVKAFFMLFNIEVW